MTTDPTTISSEPVTAPRKRFKLSILDWILVTAILSRTVRRLPKLVTKATSTNEFCVGG